jgi:type VI secretion system protein ImpK
MSDPFAYFSGADDTIRRPLQVGATAPARNGRDAAANFDGNARPRFGDISGMDLDEDFFGGKQQKAPRGFEAEFGLGDRKPSSESMRQRSDSTIDKAFELAAVNPLVSAASPLLWLAGRLNESAPPDDMAEFRDRTVEEIRRFETSAMAKDVPNRAVRVARYALCAVIDDVILNTSWGGMSGWASMSLVGTLYNETWGGERFYDLLSQLQMQPEDNIDGLELMAICLAIGFSGKYRVMEGGQGQLTRLRHDLYRTRRIVR